MARGTLHDAPPHFSGLLMANISSFSRLACRGPTSIRQRFSRLPTSRYGYGAPFLRFKINMSKLTLFIFPMLLMGLATPLLGNDIEFEARTRKVAQSCVDATVGLLVNMKAGEVSCGSGVVVSPDGLLLTAGHVLGFPGSKVLIRYADGRICHGLGLGVCKETDTAMIRITDPTPKGGWTHAELAPDQSAAKNDWMLATGNPGGIVIDRPPPLRLGRVIEHNDIKILTDCSVIFGDSGGPLFDLQGRVVGIHSTIKFGDHENADVPIKIFRAQWADLLAGKNIQSKSGVLAGEKVLSMESNSNLMAETVEEAKKSLSPEQKQDMIQMLKAKLGEQLKGFSDAMLKTILERVIAGDTTDNSKVLRPTAEDLQPQAKKLDINNPAEVKARVRHDLWQAYPKARLTEALVDRLAQSGRYDPKRDDLAIPVGLNELIQMGVSLGNASDTPAQPSISPKSRKQAEDVVRMFDPMLDRVRECSAIIFCDDTPSQIGTWIDSSGLMVTKASELHGKITIARRTGEQVEATIVGTDEMTDIALLKVPNTNGIQPIHFTTSPALLGEWLITPIAGVPLIGVVSVPERHIPKNFSLYLGEENTNSIAKTDLLMSGKPSRRLDFPSAIQHDCAIKEDQCGSPLLNSHGEAVGINIAHHDKTCSFALPSWLVLETIKAIKNSAKE